jgi:hypothetical protein
VERNLFLIPLLRSSFQDPVRVSSLQYTGVLYGNKGKYVYMPSEQLIFSISLIWRLDKFQGNMFDKLQVRTGQGRKFEGGGCEEGNAYCHDVRFIPVSGWAENLYQRRPSSRGLGSYRCHGPEGHVPLPDIPQGIYLGPFLLFPGGTGKQPMAAP